MQTPIKPETKAKAQQIYEQYKEIIDMDASGDGNSNPWERAVARTILQLAGEPLPGNSSNN
ncbi:hypothetical protein [Methanohalophilus portucalensis]|uniref:Uncharacterized protein n=2 Tax=Methanohalophilus portucalensis TaxID=39664 RepID=A0A1L9C2P8_9EURY|nr:hypothetical protein [Methanohalophilus portucalensis]ATU07659.1 hypothetical protein BKM01_02010 [Methanohalophilus portucalensis]OJH48800.1 hypothetical protein MPF_1648 [Methanohalophilus portucalensis FDF-1]RNI08782.1 hypothetical protein EFE41_09755 [Methanohalophilus portucalensis FDF-1]SMH37045.1 hypothetical protein SAMN06264941_1114 [Methanohalophilus portucalensis FDF-1]